MTPDLLAPLARKLESLGVGSPELREAVMSVVTRTRRVGAGVAIFSADEAPSEVCVLLEGLAMRHKLLPDGGRQILSFRIAGDFCEAQTLVSPVLDFGVSAGSACVLAVISRHALQKLAEAHPELGAALWRETVANAAVEREWVANLGRRSAAERLAHLLCEVQTRLHGAGLANGGSFAFPVTQTDLADALGLSTVHVNRSLQLLRRTGLISFSGGVVKVLEPDPLHALAGFDPAYLELEIAQTAPSLRGESRRSRQKSAAHA